METRSFIRRESALVLPMGCAGLLPIILHFTAPAHLLSIQIDAEARQYSSGHTAHPKDSLIRN
jgi:hypothetical protein